MCTKRHVITAMIYDRKGNVISIGRNHYTKTHPLQAKHAALVGEPYKVFRHAEIDAIVRCKQLDKAYRMEITRYTVDGKPALAKPCRICQSAISQTPIQVVEFTEWNQIKKF